jgi:hypothetical protein
VVNYILFQITLGIIGFWVAFAATILLSPRRRFHVGPKEMDNLIASTQGLQNIRAALGLPSDHFWWTPVDNDNYHLVSRFIEDEKWKEREESRPTVITFQNNTYWIAGGAGGGSSGITVVTE